MNAPFESPLQPKSQEDGQNGGIVASMDRPGIKSFLSKKPVIILFAVLFALITSILILRSYAATTTLTKTWNTNADWTANSQLDNVAVSDDAVRLAVAKSGSTPVNSGTDLARKQPVVASSVERGGSATLNATKAVDGDSKTRWASRMNANPQWIYVDLGAKYNVNRVVLNWETAYAKTYKVQVSDDAQNWTNIYSTQAGAAGIADLTGLKGSGRYVRMYATVRGTQWGYSLWDFQVYSATASTASNTTTYESTGKLALTFDAGVATQSVDWSAIATDTDVPSGTTLALTYQTSADNQTWSSAVSDIGSAADSRYLRINASLQTTNTAVTPTLKSVTLTYIVTTTAANASFTANSLTATVNGTSVTATANVKASTAVTVSNYGICARDAADNNVDFGTNTDVAMTTSGVSFTSTKTFAAGTYTYFACVNYNGSWTKLGTKTFTVTTAGTSTGGGTSTDTNPQPVGVSGTWNLKFDDEFNGTAVDYSKWETQEGWSMNNMTIHASNLAVSGGNLLMTLASSNSGAQLSSAPYDNTASNRYKLPVGGYAEARVYFPGNGTTIYNWPGFWTSGAGWPAGGEHDVAEGLGTLTVNYHSSSGAHNQGTVSGTWSNAFHTYGIHRKANSADVYYDGKLVKSYPTDDNGVSHALILTIGADNTQVYGAAGQLKVDYVRAWE